MRKLLTTFTIIFLLASCSSLKVNYDMDQSVEFNQFKTFSFYPWDYKHGFQINEYDKETILIAIQDGMENKGYTYKKEGGDLVISLFVTLEGKTDYTAYTNHYGGWAGYGGGWGYSGFGYGYGYGPGYSSTTVSQSYYNQGTVIIDAFSAVSKKLVWQGIGSDNTEANLEKRDRTLPKKIAQVMMKFPVSK